MLQRSWSSKQLHCSHDATTTSGNGILGVFYQQKQLRHSLVCGLTVAAAARTPKISFCYSDTTGTISHRLWLAATSRNQGNQVARMLYETLEIYIKPRHSTKILEVDILNSYKFYHSSADSRAHVQIHGFCTHLLNARTIMTGALTINQRLSVSLITSRDRTSDI